MTRNSPQALWSVAYKEFLHIARDWRILVLLISFPPVFTLMIGHAFEVGSLTDVPTILRDEDGSPESRLLVEHLKPKEAFKWRFEPPGGGALPDLLHAGVHGIVVIPKGWGAGLNSGEPIPIQATLDGSDTTTAPALSGMLEQALGEFQIQARETLVENLPDEMIEMGKKIPEDFRHKIVSLMEPWSVSQTIVYNPKLRFVDFVAPGLIGLILTLLTVPLVAVTITREREGGTLSQLLLTSLRHWEIVVGKVLPYFALSTVLIAVVMLLIRFHFGVALHRLEVLSVLCFLMLLCSLGLGLVISAFCNTQAQAIQFAVFFLVPIIPLCGAFAPLDQLPDAIRAFAEVFPLTHFCRAFRMVNMANAELSFLAADAAFLAIGAVVTFAAAALLLRRTQG
jgi:ABC-2 type transport system permease protein